MSSHTKHALKILGAIFAALVCAAAGGFILRTFLTFAGLMTGSGLILLSLAIAFPTPFQKGVVVLKNGLLLILPVVTDALPGGSRKTDPPAEP